MPCSGLSLSVHFYGAFLAKSSTILNTGSSCPIPRLTLSDFPISLAFHAPLLCLLAPHWVRAVFLPLCSTSALRTPRGLGGKVLTFLTLCLQFHHLSTFALTGLHSRFIPPGL
uniref:Uncharacterized protein n=1 Tax=Cercocebus atys TaxID=9531 RepID=A0A2K5KV29_CERAT